MSNFPSQLFIFVRNLLVEVRTVSFNLLRLQEKVEAVSKQKQSEKDADDKPRSPIVSVLTTPSAIRVQAETYEHRNSWRKAFEILEPFGVIAVVAYAFLTYFMWQANKKAAEAASGAADTARNTLVMSERAWVGQAGPIWLKFFTANDGRPAAEIHLNLVNFGNSPALFVFENALLTDHSSLIKTADETCKFARGMAGLEQSMVVSGTGIPMTGQSIFPKQALTLTGFYGPVKSRTVVLYAVGCVIYRDDVTNGIWWTRFCQETPSLASAYKDGQPLTTCNVYNETGKYER